MSKLRRLQRHLTESLHSIPFKRRLFTGFAWTFVMRVLTVVMGMVVSALLARLLEPESMGAYFLVFSLVAIASTVAQLGLNQAIVRLIAESIGVGDPGRARRAIRLVFWSGGVGAVVIAGILYFGVGRWLAQDIFRSSYVAGVLGLAALWIIVLTFQRLLSEAFRGFHDIRLAVTFGGFVSSTVSAAFFAVLLAASGHSTLREVLLLTVAAGVLSACVAGALLLGRVRPLERTGDLPVRVVAAIAWPLLVANVVNVLLMRADIWILGMYRLGDEVALYGAAARLVMLVSMPMLIVGVVMPPMIAELFAQGRRDELERVLRFSATLAALPSLCVLLVFVFFGDWVLGVIFGPFYAGADGVLVILSVGQLFNALAGASSQLLMMTGHQRALLVIVGIAGATAIALGALSAERYGMLGVAAAFAIGVGIHNLGAILYGVRTIGVRTYVGVSDGGSAYRTFKDLRRLKRGRRPTGPA